MKNRMFMPQFSSSFTYSVVLCFFFPFSLSSRCHLSLCAFLLTCFHQLSTDRKVVCSLFFSELIISLFYYHTVETHRHSRGHNCCACQSSWTFTEMSFRDLNFCLLFDTHVKLFSSGFCILSAVKAQQMPFSLSFIPLLSLFSIYFIHPKPTNKTSFHVTIMLAWH